MNANNSEIITKKIVIIGGGFAGAVLAKRLEKKLPSSWDIYLLSDNNYITFSPLLAEVVGASILPGHVVAPLRHMLTRTKIRMVTVDRIDLENNRVHYHNTESNHLVYDQLVFAAGVRANLTMVPGMENHALPLKTVGDALFIRNRIISNLEEATIHADSKRRKQLTTFVIIGGGFSGVEVVGELDDFLKAAEKYYKNVKREDCRIVLVHSSARLLPELSGKLGLITQKLFTKRGVDIHLNARVTGIEKEKVTLESGKIVSGATIISTVGTQGHHFIQQDSLPLQQGRILANEDMSVKGLPGVWALGDCAIIPNAYNGKNCPPTAQFAERQAKHLAKNLVAFLNNQPTREFSYKPAGMLASIGHNKAVAEIYGFKFSGFIAWLFWRGVYLLKVPTLSRKIRLYLEWNWAMFFPPDIAHLSFIRTKTDPEQEN